MACCNREHETLREREKEERVWGREAWVWSGICIHGLLPKTLYISLSSDLRCIPPFFSFSSFLHEMRYGK